jgi:hypothetical protein
MLRNSRFCMNELPIFLTAEIAEEAEVTKTRICLEQRGLL